MNNLLYIAWQPEEVFFHLGPIPVRWYGMCWLIGLALGYFMMQWLYKRHKYPTEKFEPLFLYVFIGVLAVQDWDIASSMSQRISSHHGTDSSQYLSLSTIFLMVPGSIQASKDWHHTVEWWDYCLLFSSISAIIR